jgi:oxalate decarboxylase/phosphoglucose isomerase-like protein (cupin superfamily)
MKSFGEEQFWISGNGRMTIVMPEGRARTALAKIPSEKQDIIAG